MRLFGISMPFLWTPRVFLMLAGLGMALLALTVSVARSRIRKGRERKAQARRERVERISRLLETTPRIEVHHVEVRLRAAMKPDLAAPERG